MKHEPHLVYSKILFGPMVQRSRTSPFHGGNIGFKSRWGHQEKRQVGGMGYFPYVSSWSERFDGSTTAKIRFASPLWRGGAVRQLVGPITRRSRVQILLPQFINNSSLQLLLCHPALCLGGIISLFIVDKIFILQYILDKGCSFPLSDELLALTTIGKENICHEQIRIS